MKEQIYMRNNSIFLNLEAIKKNAAHLIGKNLFLWHLQLTVANHGSKPDKVIMHLSDIQHPLGKFILFSPTIDLKTVKETLTPIIHSKKQATCVFTNMELPTEMDAYIKEQGFTTHTDLICMGIDIADLPRVPLPEGYDFIQIEQDKDKHEWIKQFAVGYEIPLEFSMGINQWLFDNSKFNNENRKVFAIRHKGKIVATSMYFLADGLAGIYEVSTIPEERRKGLGAYITLQPLVIASKMGYRIGVLQATEAGYHLYNHLGFKTFGYLPVVMKLAGG